MSSDSTLSADQDLESLSNELADLKIKYNTLATIMENYQESNGILLRQMSELSSTHGPAVAKVIPIIRRLNKVERFIAKLREEHPELCPPDDDEPISSPSQSINGAGSVTPGHSRQLSSGSNPGGGDRDTMNLHRLSMTDLRRHNKHPPVVPVPFRAAPERSTSEVGNCGAVSETNTGDNGNIAAAERSTAENENGGAAALDQNTSPHGNVAAASEPNTSRHGNISAAREPNTSENGNVLAVSEANTGENDNGAGEAESVAGDGAS